MTLRIMGCELSAMKKVQRYSTRLLFLVFVWPVSCLFAQVQPMDSLVSKFSRFRNQTLQEKIFIHTDRSFYLTGETMWFKLYYVDGTFHRPLELSKVAYVEVLDKNGKAVVQTKIALVEGYGNGSVFLPASLSSGNYLVRGYTRWMRNFSPDFYFHELITVVNPFTRLGLAPPPEKPEYDAQFFPEGGNWVNGIHCTTAFKVTNAQGKGISFTGVILDEKNDTVAHLHPLKFGMGSVSFTPSANHTYRALMKDKKNNEFVHALPAVLPEGYGIRVTDTLDKIRIEVQAQGAMPKHRVYLLIHTRQVIHVAETHFLEAGKTQIFVDKKVLGEGISHITIFNEDLLPVCERLYFRFPEKKLLIDILPDQSQYSTRRKVNVNFFAHTQDGKPVPANFSLAVYALDSLSSKPPDIASYLWLNSDLKGMVESPGYYFTSTGDTVNRAIDNLMLTQGWSRYLWDEILNFKKRPVEFIPEFRGHIVTGKVLHESSAPGNQIITFLASPGKTIKLYPSRSDQNGNVQFELKNFFGPRKIIVQPNSQLDSTYHVEISSPFSERPSSFHCPSLELSESLKNQIAGRSLHMQVQNTFAEEKNIHYATPVIDSASFYGKPDERYLLDDYTRFPTMEEVLREYVPGVLVRKKKNKFRLKTLDIPNETAFQDNPLVLLDGVPVFDINKIIAFDPRKVRQLEVMTRRYYLGPSSFQGVVSFTTYHGDLSDLESDFGSLILNYEGLQLNKEFYSPRYETARQLESRIPDVRSLLYWCPTLDTDVDGKQHCDFYTPDLPGNYAVVVQGITRDGTPGTATVTLHVQRTGN